MKWKIKPNGAHLGSNLWTIDLQLIAQPLSYERMREGIILIIIETINTNLFHKNLWYYIKWKIKVFECDLKFWCRDIMV